MLKLPLDTSPALTRLRRVSPGFVKQGGEKTNVPLLDGATGKRVWWLSLVLFPKETSGGEDVAVFARCASDSEPIALNDGEAPLVELVGAAVSLNDRGFSLEVDGVKRIPEQQKAKA
jgi:hypothetical protein